MSLHTEVTKARILAERAYHDYQRAQAKADEFKHVYTQRWLRYVTLRREEGSCALCERPLDECRCVIMAEVG